jgi:hypothetical protein
MVVMISQGLDQVVEDRSELLAGTVDSGFHGFNRTFQDFSDFGLGQSLVDRQYEWLPQLGGQASNRLAHRSGSFLSLHLLVRARSFRAQVLF